MADESLDLPDLLKRVGDLKTQGKNRRDLRRYDRAVVLLKQAIDCAHKGFEAAGNLPDWRVKFASELSDSWGILGGVERRLALDASTGTVQRLAHLQESIKAYDEGYSYESDPVFGSPTKTYNRLNRLIVRLLLSPGRLTAHGEASNQEANGVNLRSEFEATATLIRKHGVDSVWAASDLALLNVLLGHQDAASAYAPFEKLEPPDFACQSALDVLTPLASLDLPTAPELKNAELLLTKLLHRLTAR
jgi:hypothetical protein